LIEKSLRLENGFSSRYNLCLAFKREQETIVFRKRHEMRTRKLLQTSAKVSSLILHKLSPSQRDTKLKESSPKFRTKKGSSQKLIKTGEQFEETVF
jgi:hypothetical protein